MLEKKTLQGQSRKAREQKALGTGKNKQNKKQKEYIKLYTRAPEKHLLRPHVINLDIQDQDDQTFKFYVPIITIFT